MSLTSKLRLPSILRNSKSRMMLCFYSYELTTS